MNDILRVRIPNGPVYRVKSTLILCAGNVTHELPVSECQSWRTNAEDFAAPYIIRINAWDSIDRQNETLLHEIMHAVEYELVQRGKLIQESAEEYIEELGALLYQTLAMSGLWRQVQPVICQPAFVFELEEE